MSAVRFKGRFRARIVEFVRDRKGRPKFAFSPRGFLYSIYAGFRLWRHGHAMPWRMAYLMFAVSLVVKRVVEDGIVINNGAVTQGLNYLAEAGFRGGTQISTWYASLINNAAYTAIADADTAASHAGWAEWTGYNEAVRQTWSPAAASAGVLANGTVMTFTNNSGSTVSIRGMFLQSTSGKGATTGTLWATAVEGSARSLSNGQAFQVIYETEFTPVS